MHVTSTASELQLFFDTSRSM